MIFSNDENVQGPQFGHVWIIATKLKGNIITVRDHENLNVTFRSNKWSKIIYSRDIVLAKFNPNAKANLTIIMKNKT